MTTSVFELIGIQNYLRGNENTLHFCLPLIRNRHHPEQIFFASRHSWVSRLDPDYFWVSEQESAKTLHPVAKNEVNLVGSLINPPRTIALQQSVAQAGPELLNLVNQLDSDKFELLFGDFFNIEQGFKGKLLYVSEYEELTREIIDLGITVFDREMERTRGNRLTTLAKIALELFRYITTEEDRRLKAMALRLYIADMIIHDTTYTPLAQYYEQERRNNQSELQTLAQKKYFAILKKLTPDNTSTTNKEIVNQAEKAFSKVIATIPYKNMQHVKSPEEQFKKDLAYG